MEIVVDEHKGMNVHITPEKLPSYLYQKIHNLELSKKLGRMVKRKGYANILTTGLTTLKSMFEFVDRNDGRQILLQDGTGLEESVYSGGSYGAISAISNDERTAGSTVNQAYPEFYSNEIRSGAGLNASTDLPFWYGYISRNRFNDGVTITGGNYLDNQFYDSRLGDIFFDWGVEEATSEVDEEDIDQGNYLVYVSPVIDGDQRGFPEDDVVKGFANQQILKVAVDGKCIWLQCEISTSDNTSYPRLTAFDIFVAKSISLDEDPINSPAYFLTRVDLNDEPEPFFEVTGTSNTPANKITIADYADWLTFKDVGNLFVYDATNQIYHRIQTYALNGSDVELTVTPVSDSGGSITCRFLSKWYDDGSSHWVYSTFFDNYYHKLGSEMYEYLDLPLGDTGRGSDLRYKYSCISNKRYFIFGVPEGPFGYFSKVDDYDVIPALNILKLKKEPTGCVSIGRDVMAFYKDSAKRFTVLSNERAEEDDEFSDIGLVDQKALYQLSDQEAYGFDQRGPWHLLLRNHYFIGENLKEWWEENLSETEKDACVVGYNRLKNWVMFSFPTYTTSPYTNGIVFVYDRDAEKRDGVQVWWILKTDTPLYNFTVADDLHQLAGSRTKIVDFNTTGTPDETVDTLALLKVIQNPILGNRMHVGRAYLDYDSTTDTITAKVSADGAAQETLTINGDKQSVIKYMCKTLELELSTTATLNDMDYGSHVITFQPKRV